MNIIQRAKEKVSAEASSVNARAINITQNRARTRGHVEGELAWYGEFNDPKETRPCKLTGGDKQVMTPQEQKLFARTQYERGITEYEYEGSLRVVRPGHDKDPRHSYRDGPRGTMKYPTGEMYEGAWRSNKRHGEGTLTTPRGYWYQGNWTDDSQVGPGRETFSCKSVFDGNFENGLPEGQGVLVFVPETKYRYEGEFHQGRRHGKGTIFYPDGDTFTGTWDGGKRHGRGVTTTFNELGKEIQLESEWDQDALLSGPSVIERTKRTKKPKSTLNYSTQTLIPADLTKWKVKDEVTELPMEHFLRIKLGFEKLDVNRSGSLSTAELTAIWGDGSQAMLQKLDEDGNGGVELDEIFAAWYPAVPAHNIQRFMCLDINPRDLLRLRGYLAGVRDDLDLGFMQVVGVKNLATEEDKPLTQKHLDQAGWKIGGERFTMANFEAAKVINDPPHFVDVLQAWYPNIPRTTLMRYEMAEIPDSELEAIKTDFYKLSKGDMELSIAVFEEAQDRFQQEKLDANEVLDAHVKNGFFLEQPFWPMGGQLPINLSVALLKLVDRYDGRFGEGVSLQQLLRYTWPNVKCKRAVEHLTSGRRKGHASCNCQICSIS